MSRPAVLSPAELKELRDSMTMEEFRALTPILLAIREPVTRKIGPKSDIVTPAFDAAFTRRLQVFHALHDPNDCLNKRGFEFAFKEAMEAGGKRSVELTGDPTFPGRDAVVDGKARFSLKTEAERGMRPDRIKISKLMESIWTKALTDTRQFREGLRHILRHLDGYDRILTLRIFGRRATGTIRYELWEIPKELFGLIAKARLDDFSAVTKAGSTTLSVRVNGTLAFEVVFDGSDQKITIRNLNTDFCTLHGVWTIGTP